MAPAEYMIAILKVLSVLMVVYLSFRKAGTGMEKYLRVIPVITGALIIHCFSSGLAGLIFVTTGMIVGAFCALVQYRYDRIDSGELVVSAAVGALAGPSGIFFIFIIIYFLSISEMVLHAGTTRIRERYAGYLVDAGMIEGAGPVAGDVKRSSPCRAAEAIRLQDLTFPWKAKIALATLVIVFSGLML